MRTSVGGSSRKKKPIKANEIQKGKKLSPIINELFMFEFVFITHCTVFSFILIHRRARPTISCLRDKTLSPADIWERDSIDSSLVADQFRSKLAFFIRLIRPESTLTLSPSAALPLSRSLSPSANCDKESVSQFFYFDVNFKNSYRFRSLQANNKPSPVWYYEVLTNVSKTIGTQMSDRVKKTVITDSELYKKYHG